jgi:hypothetical protein
MTAEFVQFSLSLNSANTETTMGRDTYAILADLEALERFHAMAATSNAAWITHRLAALNGRLAGELGSSGVDALRVMKRAQAPEEILVSNIESFRT